MPLEQQAILDKHAAWWSAKMTAVALRCFDSDGGAGAGRWAVHIFWHLLAGPDTPITAPSLRHLSGTLGVPPKYISRAVATLTRCGLLTGTLTPSVALTLHRDRLTKHKNPAASRRRPISARERSRLFEADRHGCGMCGKAFPATELHVDHIIPISLLGADEPANWVAACGGDNRDTWDSFFRTKLKRYRGEPVTAPMKLRFQHGFFWPVINGRLRRETRADWTRD